MARQLLRGLPLLSALAAPALAQSSSSVTAILLPGLDAQTVFASVVSVDAPSKTTYFVACPTDEDSTECGLGSGATVVEGPSTFELHMTESGVLTADVSCKIASSTAVCSSTLNEVGMDETASSLFTSTDTGAETITDLSTLTSHVTITAGLDKLSGAASQTAGASGSSATGASSTGATAAGTSSSTAGMPMITGNAVLAGMAAVVGGAMMM